MILHIISWVVSLWFICFTSANCIPHDPWPTSWEMKRAHETALRKRLRSSWPHRYMFTVCLYVLEKDGVITQLWSNEKHCNYCRYAVALAFVPTSGQVWILSLLVVNVGDVRLFPSGDPWWFRVKLMCALVTTVSHCSQTFSQGPEGKIQAVRIGMDQAYESCHHQTFAWHLEVSESGHVWSRICAPHICIRNKYMYIWICKIPIVW